jgi:hypothetical protein
MQAHVVDFELDSALTCSGGSIIFRLEVYTYGVVLMELTTERRAVEVALGEGQYMVGWVCREKIASNMMASSTSTCSYPRRLGAGRRCCCLGTGRPCAMCSPCMLDEAK